MLASLASTMNSKSHSKLKRTTTLRPWNHSVGQTQASVESYVIFSASLQNRLQTQISYVLDIKILTLINYLRAFCTRAVSSRVSLQAYRIMATRSVSQR